ncbi:glycosyltransferase [Microbacterium sp. MEC084]|uniref:glycosyltransferase family 2 protein n=1 Tax=Microbacterium sp. MEC084 TaxID=1963027 RepID=UPI001E30CFCF|nr:glycosyltransferase family 2 protein [Microbacterium sp. MEC084]MCD1268176.1 glycosyltransferase [Microbacterium sp. MEC084]
MTDLLRRGPRSAAVRLEPLPSVVEATVSVVIPCFQYERYLEQAVRSALDQGGVDVEVIVVDDASTDGSLALARRLEEQDPRVRVVANDVNSGPVATFNRGLELAGGEFLVRLDADDLLTPGALLRAVAVMQHLPAVGLVYGHPLHFSHGRAPARTRPTAWTVWSGRAWLEARCATGANVITSPEAVMRRSVVDLVGGQRDLAHTHDMEMWLRIAAHSDVAHLEGCDQAWHREHPRSLSRRADDPRVFLREKHAAFETLCDGLADSGGLRRSARRAIAREALAYARGDLDRGIPSALVDDLRALALEVDPGIEASAGWRAFEAARRRASSWPRSAAVAAGAAPRIARRLRADAQFRRWHRTGVFEPVAVASGALPAGDATGVPREAPA